MFYLGGLVVGFFFESFTCVVAADMSVQEHLFHYWTDLLL